MSSNQPEATAAEQSNQPPALEAPLQRLSVIGIGASAGGLAALRSLFAALPDKSSLTFVVVVHLSPEHESILADLLQPYTNMPVIQVQGRTEMQPNHVYVIPPAKQLMVTDRALDLVDYERTRHAPMQIDSFFRSLAGNHGDGGAIILSGSGSDGAVGIQAIKEKGGLIFVQSPDEAQYDGMPRSAIATGLVDVVAPVAALAVQLVAAKQTRPSLPLPADGEDLSESAQQTLAQILTQLRVRSGHDFSGYKPATLLRRLARRMQLTQLTTLTAYLQRLRQDGAEAEALFRDLLINVTEFFRDKEAWDALESTVIPLLFAGKGRDDTVRVWTVGCATGEEAYSIAMLLLAYASQLVAPPTIQIFASDLSKPALDFAREGCYPEAIADDVPAARLTRFFTKENNHYRARPELREAILFTQHNLLQDPPFSKLDLILCRNLLIYIQRELQEQVFETFYYALRPQGRLFLGNAESAEGATELFETLDKRHRLYQRRARSNAPPILPTLPLLPHPARRATGGAEPVRPASPTPGEEHHLLLETAAPPSILVDREYNILHLSETAGRYLLPPGGAPTTDLLKLARRELQAELRTALFRAFDEDKAIFTQPLLVQFNGAPHRVYLLVRPQRSQLDAGGDLRALVIFWEDDTPVTDANSHTANDGARQQVEAELRHLQGRLQSMREEYETTVEELRAANEELQSTNEEYKSTLEELETSKEELQSVNEELQTINQELKNKVEEVTQAHNDLQNLFVATDIATLFLDRELRVKRYTPRTVELFNLMAPDRGRPIAHLRTNLLYEQLDADAHRVLADLMPLEREVQSRDGRWFLVRVRPYRTFEDRIDGVVMTFVDITGNKQAEEAVRRNEERQAFLLKLSDALRPLADATKIQATVTRAAMDYFGADRCYYCEIEGNNAIIRQDASRQDLPSVVGVYALASMPIFKAVVEAGRPFVVTDATTTALMDEALRQLCLQMQILSYIDVPVIKEGKPVGILCITQSTPRNWTDVEVDLAVETAERTWAAGERARAEEALAVSEEKYRTLFESIDEGVATMELILDDEGRTTDWLYLEHNPALARLTGISQNIVGKKASDIYQSLEPFWMETFGRVVRDGVSERFEYGVAELGNRWFDVYAARVGGTGSRQIVLVYNNITERKRREANLAFLAEVSADFAPLANVEEVMERVGVRLARHLNLSRCDFSVVDEPDDRITTIYDWRVDEALPSVLGEHRISTFLNAAGRQTLAAGNISAIADVRHSSLMNAPAEMMQALGIGAVVDTPYLEHGRWCFLLSACRATATVWREDEIELIRELTTRIYIRLERARAEAALRQSEERFRTLVAKGADMITISDQSGKIVYASPTTLQVTGYTPEEFMQQHPFTSIHADDRPACEAAFQQLLATPGLTLDLQHRFLHKDGTWHWLEGAFTSLYHDPAIGGLLANVRDITARKDAETALQHLNATLEQQVDTRTVQVRALASELSMAEQEERRRISQILHDDLQQLLYGMQMRMMAMMNDLAAGNNSTVTDYAREVYDWMGDAIQTTRRLTVDLSPPVLKHEGLTDMLRWLVTQMAAVHGLQVDLQATTPCTVPDEDMRVLLFQSVRELLFNVVKHAETNHATIELSTGEADACVIVVSDQGRGFDVSAAIQQPSGLGLYRVRERINLFGGRMMIDAAPGQGTRITIYTPVSVWRNQGHH